MSDYLIPGRFLNYEKEALKAKTLDRLYHQLGRDNPDHPMHGLYTGLWEEAQDLDTWLSLPHEVQVQCLLTK